MKLLPFLLLITVCQPSVNLDQRTDWHTCVRPSCDPGGEGTPTFVDHVPGVKGAGRASMRFDVEGPKYTNALWYVYVGATPGADIGLIDLWTYLPAEDNYAQAIEFDAFQYITPVRYMFGTQCNQLGDGRWDVWDMLHSHWVTSSVPCSLSKNAWHHVQIAFHRGGVCDGWPCEFYDSITIDNHVNAVNMVEPSGPLPAGWGENSGLNVQLDIGPVGATISEYVDQANLLLFGF